MQFLIYNLLNDGGPTFMYPVLFMLIACVILIVTIFLKKENYQKLISILKHVSLFAVVWGFLGFFLGLIMAFDSLESLQGEASTAMLAGGLKVALLAPVFGIVTFIVTRVGLIFITIFKN